MFSVVIKCVEKVDKHCIASTEHSNHLCCFLKLVGFAFLLAAAAAFCPDLFEEVAGFFDCSNSKMLPLAMKFGWLTNLSWNSLKAGVFFVEIF